MLIIGFTGMLSPKPALIRVYLTIEVKFILVFLILGYQASSEYKKVLRLNSLISGILRNSHRKEACR